MNVENNGNDIVLDTSAESRTSNLFKNIKLLNSVRFDEHCEQLKESQLKFVNFINDWFREPNNSVCLITGGPGTGKTFTAVETLKHVNANILKLAPTNKLARAIHGLTIHAALNLHWTEGSTLQKVFDEIKQLKCDEFFVDSCLTASSVISAEALESSFTKLDIVIIDEIGMVPFWLTYQIIVFLFKSFDPLLIILLGDENQLRPVGCIYNIFDVELPNIPSTLLRFTENNRFTPEYEIIINNLKVIMHAKGDVVSFVSQHFPVYEHVTESLFKQCNKILAYTNKTVLRYNDQYLDLIKGPNIILVNLDHSLDDAIRVKVGCRVMSTSNEIIPKGVVMTFLNYDNITDTVHCQLLDESLVNLWQSRYTRNFPIEVAFAITIHKFQGDTIDDHIIINFDHSADDHLLYTALSRVKSKDQILGIINIDP